MNNNPPCLPDAVPAAQLVPGPANLDYSFGLPDSSYCLSMTRSVVRRLLSGHGLAHMAELGTLAASELLANAYLFTPGHGVSLSVRWRFGVLRLTVFDRHPAHAEGGDKACRERRREALSMLDAVIDACGGLCGLDEAGAPLGGCKMWVVISREAALNYARL
ncbi:ATP-binding protein [Streptomyces sp. ISL-11]|uniref:ATP-binding protein n=1 Tax=Streptomyces sp. ISL-11 TaxID=2819174 RepID=UPI001BEAFF48|nr:ATP-binding protein [Streptomyces sp. ISL-11]MBT2383796.1 ATP-binding protein [Streptomyces sp. ISL-11]